MAVNEAFWVLRLDLADLFGNTDGDAPGTPWEVFSDYAPVHESLADRGDARLSQQRRLIDSFISRRVERIPMDPQQIDALIDAVQAAVEGFDDEDVAELPPGLGAAAEDIVATLSPLALTPRTLDAFLTALADRLHGVDPDMDVDDESGDSIDDPADGDHPDMSGIGDFSYPLLPLALSVAGEEGDEEDAEAWVSEAFEAYRDDISARLGQGPDPGLQPLPVDVVGADDAWERVDAFVEGCPFAAQFLGRFSAWSGADKVLFLTAESDEGASHAIHLGGLDMGKFREILEAWNGLLR